MGVVFETSSDLICTIGLKGELQQIGTTMAQRLGYTKVELSLGHLSDLVVPAQKMEVCLLLTNASQKSEPISADLSFITKQGQPVAVHFTLEKLSGEAGYFCLGKVADSSDLHPAQLPNAWHQALIENGSDLLAVLDAQGYFLYSGGGTQKLLGYAPHEVIGSHVLEYIHPEDLALAQNHLLEVMERRQIFIPEVRFKSKNGDWKWVETLGVNHLQTPGVLGIVLNSREITERRSSSFKLEETERRFQALFENNPDVIIIEKEDGTILDANPSFLQVFGLASKAEVIGQHVSAYLPASVVPLCLAKLQEAFTGKTVNYEIAIPNKTGEQVLHITKIPVVIEGKVSAVHTMVKDITEAVVAQRIINQQTEKLRNVLESITDAYFLLDAKGNYLFINKECDRMLGLNREERLGQNLWEAYPEAVGGQFWENYHQAVNTGAAGYFEEYYPPQKKWLGVKMFPSTDGLSVYFTDVSERVAAQQELEKLSLVASKTTNGVVITDSNGYTEWVNEGFTRMTGYTLEDLTGQKPGKLLQGEDTNPETVAVIREKLAQAIPFNATLVNYRKNGERFWVSMDIAPIFHENGKITRFIAIQKDITLRKENEQRQLEMTKDLYLQNRDLQQFTYIVSHNLRAPVANAMGLADLLTKIDKDSVNFDVSLANLKKSVFKLDTVLRDLNMILSIRDNREVLEKETVDLADVCKQALLNYEEALAQCQGQVEYDIQPGISLYANRAYLYSIFYNLFSNAIKYRQESEQLKIKIRVFGTTEHGTVITFSDNGTGFDMKKAGPDVFRLYKRFHRNKKGRGIGLFLVKTHVETMNGRIEVSSSPNKGAHFIIYLK
nr:PAS domain S-box protein [Rufibacter sp. LB8]